MVMDRFGVLSSINVDKSVAGGKGQLKGGGLLRGRKERQSLETGCLAFGVFYFLSCVNLQLPI